MISKAIIPEGYEQNHEDRVSRLHTNPTGGRGMRISGTVKCPKTDCERSVQFALRTHDTSKIEFTTICKRCKTKIALTFFIATWTEKETTPYEMIEKAQPKEEVKEENAVEQSTTPAKVKSGKSDEDQDKQSGDEQGKTESLGGEKEWNKAAQEDPFAGLE